MKFLPGSARAHPKALLKAAAACAAVLVPASLTASCAPAKIDSSCPQVFIAQDLGMLSRYRAAGSQDASTLQFAAEMRDIRGDCTVKPGDADVRLTVSIVGERAANDHSGPNGKPLQSADLVYFAAITDPGGAIVYKQQFTTSLQFGDNRRAGTMEELDPHIPLPKNATAAGYKVLLGFQLTPQEVDDNRRQRGAPPLNASATTPAPRPIVPAPLPPLPAPPPPSEPVKQPARRPAPAPRRPAPSRPRPVPPPSGFLPDTPSPGPSTAPASPAPYSGPLVPGYVAPGLPAPTGE